MKLTAKGLTEGEDAILDALEHTPSDRCFLGRLYRDGRNESQGYSESMEFAIEPGDFARIATLA